jgi:hypothetical protein
MIKTPSVVFLFDVDNVLIDNDRVQADLKEHVEQTYGVAARDRYWGILEELRDELGYVDYLGALMISNGGKPPREPATVTPARLSAELASLCGFRRSWTESLEATTVRANGLLEILKSSSTCLQPNVS